MTKRSFVFRQYLLHPNASLELLAMYGSFKFSTYSLSITIMILQETGCQSQHLFPATTKTLPGLPALLLTLAPLLKEEKGGFFPLHHFQTYRRFPYLVANICPDFRAGLFIYLCLGSGTGVYAILLRLCGVCGVCTAPSYQNSLLC